MEQRRQADPDLCHKQIMLRRTPYCIDCGSFLRMHSEFLYAFLFIIALTDLRNPLCVLTTLRETEVTEGSLVCSSTSVTSLLPPVFSLTVLVLDMTVWWCAPAAGKLWR